MKCGGGVGLSITKMAAPTLIPISVLGEHGFVYDLTLLRWTTETHFRASIYNQRWYTGAIFLVDFIGYNKVHSAIEYMVLTMPFWGV